MKASPAITEPRRNAAIWIIGESPRVAATPKPANTRTRAITGHRPDRTTNEFPAAGSECVTRPLWPHHTALSCYARADRFEDVTTGFWTAASIPGT
jgi:hypothetical protein